MLSFPDIINVVGILFEVFGFLLLLGDFWNWLNKGKWIENHFPKVWSSWANNRLNKGAILSVIFGLILQLIATLLD
jgi:hypothetical protein